MNVPKFMALHSFLIVALCASASIHAGPSEGQSRKPLPTAEEIAQLPADGGPEFNRLVHEASPYLRQHARNPVDWFPWGDEAFALAAKLSKPVFLSIGYSTCHWCHVMEHESFEDEAVAALMNEHFVCIKVDREERPDIDDVYMTVTQQTTGRGGWPMTVIMTPDKKPFFAGTYFPKNGAGGRPGMMELLPQISSAWTDQRENVVEHADKLVASLQSATQGTPGKALESSLLERAYKNLNTRYDNARGGFNTAPKFPVPHNLRFLMRYHARQGADSSLALDMVERTLREMRNGGIWDHVGFGFHRYSTDRQWLVPHFEKMLYDQALLSAAYIEGWQVTGKAEYRQTACEIFEYVLRDLSAPGGGFFSAEDADSEGEEGLFYFWNANELIGILGKEDGDFAINLWGVKREGNFAEERSGRRTGHNILHFPSVGRALDDAKSIPQGALAERIEGIRKRLFDVRERRVHPFKDDKILTDWNGLMIAALAKGGAAFSEPRYTEAARRAADYMLGTLTDDEGRLFKRARGAQVSLPGMLEDYAFATWGLLNLYEATFDVTYLRAGIAYTDLAIAHFWDAERGGFFMAPDDGEELIVRAKDAYDGAIPSGNSVAALNLVRISRFTGDEKYLELAGETMSAFAGAARRDPASMTQMMLALNYQQGPSFEVVIAGTPGAEDTEAMLAKLRQSFLPNAVVVLRPTDEEEPAICEIAGYTLYQTARGGKATAYVCQDFACAAPVTDAASMSKLMAPIESE
ncbi:MAG: hypothetical protein ACI8QZ_003059 [Chlamydiales bacterium]